jgi:hypothetical protein
MQLQNNNFREIYDRFDAPVTSLDCGSRCAPHNPTGKPFCCDICQAVPVVYHQEWEYLQTHTELWHLWRGDECPADPVDPQELLKDTPEHMCLLACKGPDHCQREYRSISCRQFPFFPYITSDDRFIGLAYHWDFEPTCWVISHLDEVTQAYRNAFIITYDRLFTHMPEDYESYYFLSEDMRAEFIKRRRRIPILHRNGSAYLLSPKSEQLTLVTPDQFRKFGPFKK